MTRRPSTGIPGLAAPSGPRDRAKGPVRATPSGSTGGRPSLRDPYGILPAGGGPAAILSAVGLVVAAALTLSLFTGQLPIPSVIGGGDGGNGTADGPARTPAPSNVVIVDPRANVPGSIVFVKSGNVWVQSGATVHQVTNTGRDSMPSWSPDGQWIYFIETRTERGLFPSQGKPLYYDLTYPLLTRVNPDGSDRKTILSGKLETNNGRYQWFSWIREPVLSPDGTTIALVSDAPDPTRSDVVLQLYDLATGQMNRATVTESPPLGHQDPAWRPVGKAQLLYVKNGRDGSRGAPAIWRYDPKAGKGSALTGPGYMEPAWSPDGAYVAATKTSSLGTDVVILDASNGTELLRVTDDDRSWSPVWSPVGDSIAYFHLESGIVDLRLATLGGSAPSWSVSKTIDLTTYSGLDGGSRPGWFVPADQLPATPPPATSPPSSSGDAPSAGEAGGSSSP
ncbi:MAG TPA: hypothetical protein VIV06_03255 [Candidatus Limnocylindrales bacterium]